MIEKVHLIIQENDLIETETSVTHKKHFLIQSVFLDTVKGDKTVQDKLKTQIGPWLLFAMIFLNASVAFAARTKGGAIGQKIMSFFQLPLDLLTGPVGWICVAVGVATAIFGFMLKRMNGSDAGMWAIGVGVGGVLLGMIPQIADEFMGAGALMMMI